MSKDIAIPLSDQEYKPEFDLIALNHPKSKYTPEQKIQVATYHVVNGDVKLASKVSGVPVSVIKNWKANADWWDELVEEVKVTKNEELEAVLTHALHLCSEEIVDRLVNGNEVVVAGGGTTRVKLPARELSQLTNTVFEKRALLRGDPSSIRQDKKVDFSDLITQFKNFSKELEEDRNRERVIN